MTASRSTRWGSPAGSPAAIAIRSGYDAITRGTGELSVAGGSYTAYARKLDIQRGRLIFTGGPIDNPGIDLRAAKVFPDVTAGVNVRGTLLQPRMSFFSDPPLPQSQIVSLILAGGSLETAQKGAGTAALGQAAALLASQVGSHVGIPDVSLESDMTNETSLVLGRYLSPRLYVSYGISLTEQLNTSSCATPSGTTGPSRPRSASRSMARCPVSTWSTRSTSKPGARPGASGAAQCAPCGNQHLTLVH